jgi:hypothetical protein
MIVEVSLDRVNGWRRIMNSYNWDDNGLYVNKQLQLFPKSSGVRCPEELEKGKMYKFGMTRSNSGEVKLYLHGGECASGSPLFSDKFSLGKEWVSFFRDDGTENSGGIVKRVRMYDQALSEVEMATLCGCTLAPKGAPCKLHILITPPDYKLAYSSVWNSDPLGKGHARGRLSSRQAWSALHNKVGQWMQFNTGEVQSIAGVVTQGRRNSDQRVTAFTVEVSEDGDTWASVECGRTFKGNKDSNTKVKTRFRSPVKAQFVRILPQKWNSHMSMRASVLVCERSCVKSKLEYTFKNEMLTSNTKGPSLEDLWGEGTFDANGRYRFEKGQGLALEQGRCLKSGAYTIYIKAAVDLVTGWRRVVQSEGWGDAGFYVNKVFQTFPVASGIKCEEQIRPGLEYQYVITRSVGGDIKLFLNGWLCGKGKPPYGGKYALDPEGLWFFRDDGSENTGGYLKKIVLWDKELSDAEVREECACELPSEGARCKYQVWLNAPYMNHRYTSIWGGDMPGIGLGRGRLNSPESWSAGAKMKVGDSMTIDTGEVQSIAGIVTQGRRNAAQWVTSLKVEVSKNGRDFKPAECGRIFDANANQNNKVSILFSVPVKARFVRIVPQTWQNWMSMRAAVLVCERPCVDNAMEFQFKGSFMSKTKGPGLEAQWGEGEFDDSGGYHFLKGQGLSLVQSRCLKGDAYTIYIKAQLAKTTGYRRILNSDGWVDHGFYVNKYFMSFPTSGGLKCPETVRPGQQYQYVISRTTDGTVSLYLNGYPCGSKKPGYDSNYKLAPEGIDFFKDDGTEESAGFVKRIQVWGKALSKKKVMEMCGCVLPADGKPCERHIIFTPFKSKITWSSAHGSDYCKEGRLNSMDAWCPGTPSKTNWIQMDNGEIESIAGVILQGRRRYAQWVTSFKVDVSDDGDSWVPVECGREFDGSSDQNSKTSVLFKVPIKTRFVRINPQSWYGWPSMRAGLLLCERPCDQAVLEYPFLESFASSTRGPSLEAPNGEGYFDQTKGYHFQEGQGLQVDEWSCVNKTAYTIYMNVQLDQTSGYRRLINSEGWGDNGIYVNKQVMSFPLGGQIVCDQDIYPGKFYQYVFSRASDGTNKLYLNGYLCGSAKLPYKKGYELAPHQLSFMQDDGKENSAGWLKKIKIWDHSLSNEEVAAECGCLLTTPGKKCKSLVVLSPADTKYKYSSTWDNDKNGFRHGRGRINSRQGWSAGRNEVGQYMQIDTGAVQDIRGVVIQGRFQVDQWVTSISLEVSDDGGSWNKVECARIYKANKDQNSRKRIIFRIPLKGRYIRFVVQSWYNHISMRAAVLVCEETCKNGELNYQMDGTLSSSTFGPMLTYDDENFGEFQERGAGSMMYRFKKGQGLTLDEAKCVTPAEWTIVILAKIDETSGKRQIIGSSSWGNDGMYVDTVLRMVPEGIGMQCKETIFNDKFYFFALTRKEGLLSLYLNGYQCASQSPKEKDGFKLAANDVSFFNSQKQQNTAGYIRNIRALKKALSKEDMASEAACNLAQVSTKKCRGLILLNPDYSKHTYSSLYGGQLPGVAWSQGRLNDVYCWYPGVANIPSKTPPYEGGNWMQIDSGDLQAIAGVAIQGTSWGWVTALSVKVSEDGSNWKHVSCGRSFMASTDSTSTVEIKFEDAVKGRYVRIFPERWSSWPALRAGILICQRECKEGHLDYTMQQDLLSSSDGSQLTAPWGQGQFQKGPHYNTKLAGGVMHDGWRYVITPGQGLRLDESDCVKPQQWSVQIHAQLSIVNSLRQIMGTKAWGDDGLYVKDVFRFIPQETKLKCSEILRNTVYYKFGLTRDKDGTLAIYLNGFKCAEAKPEFKKGYVLDPEGVDFFRNKDASKNTGASVLQIEMWNTALSPAEMAKKNGCKLPDVASACKSLVISNPAYSKHHYSSTWGDYKPGQVFGQGRLDATYSWIAQSANAGLEKGEWMQLDLGKAQAVAGVVTQGRGDGGWWTTAYSVKLSVDGDSWASVACGMVFEGNTDMHTKVKNEFPEPVNARYVRIYPVYYYGHPSMRAGVLMCETKCANGYLDYKFEGELTSSSGGPMLKTPWGYGQFFTGAKTHSNGNGQAVGSEANDQRYQIRDGKGLELNEGSCIKGETYTIIFRARLNEISGWRKIFGSSSWEEDGLYVNEVFSMQPSTLKMACAESMMARRWYDFGLTRDDKGKLRLYLNGYLCASAESKQKKGYVLDEHNVDFLRSGDTGKQPNGAIQRIQMWDKALSDADMAKASQCSLPEVGEACKGRILTNLGYKDHRYSSTWGDYPVGQVYATGALNSPRAWLCSTANTGFENGCWMQLDLGSVQNVAGIVSQGRGDGGWWVTAYSVRVSEDGDSWHEVACGQTFQANTDMNTQVKNVFSAPVKARYVRIFPMTYYGHPSMRAGLLLCEKKCKEGQLDYEFKNSLTSTTDGPALDAAWGEGRFEADKYIFNQGEGLKLDESSCIGPTKWTILMNVQIDNVNDLRQILGSKSWGSDGLYSNKPTSDSYKGIEGSMLSWQPEIDELKCGFLIQKTKWYNIGLTRQSDSTVTIYLNGYKCAEGKSANKKGYELDAKDITFMRGQTAETSASGKLLRIRLWNTVKTSSEMADMAACKPATAFQKTCKDTQALNAPYSAHRYSAVWGNYGVGTVYGRGRLDSEDAFIPPSASSGYKDGNWMQIDAGSVLGIAGVVIQGRYAGNQFLTTFLARISDDGSKWFDVECGRAFPGSHDWHSRNEVRFSTPLSGRYLRIYVDTWNNWPSFRAGLLVCESDCVGQHLDYPLKGDYNSVTGGPALKAAWGHGKYDRSNPLNGMYFSNGKGLQLDESSCIDKKETYTIIMRARLEVTTGDRKMFGSKAWGSDGGVAVADGARYQLTPSAAGAYGQTSTR